MFFKKKKKPPFEIKFNTWYKLKNNAVKRFKVTGTGPYNIWSDSVDGVIVLDYLEWREFRLHNDEFYEQYEPIKAF